jgi:hypothetical protein
MSEIVDIVSKGDRRASLVAVRDRLAKELDAAELDARSVAVVAKELRAVIAEIDKLPGGEEKSDLDRIAESIPPDELAARRANRQPGAAAPPGT